MKKILSILLSITLIFSMPTVSFAQGIPGRTTSYVDDNVRAMANIGLMTGDHTGVSEHYGSSQPTRLQLSIILQKLNGTYETALEYQGEDNFLDAYESTSEQEQRILSYIKDHPLTNPLYDNDTFFRPNEYITEADFFGVALPLLGYEVTLLDDIAILAYAKALGFETETLPIYINTALAKSLNDILKSKTVEGHEYFEVLLANGFLKDYNDGKAVPEILVFDGKTQPIFNHNDAIYEKVYVETPLDTDEDNKRDLIEVWIKRPVETLQGMKVPVIFEVSPYLQGTNDDLYIMHNVDKDLTVGTQSDLTYDAIKYIPVNRVLPAERVSTSHVTDAIVEPFDFGDWYNYFLPRGYAVVFSGGIGTYNSEGITTTGSVEETISTTAVIDWLNGRVKAYTNKTDNIEVSAYWTTGDVGMSGRSYRGTLAIAAATTGVQGLRTIVPIASISSWYDYYRSNGVNVSPLGWQGDDADLLAEYCLSRMLDPNDYASIQQFYNDKLEQMRIDQDRVTGDYNTFWDERNYVNNSDKITASVLIIHGLNDWNVKTKQYDMLWQQLEKYNVQRKIILHQGEHISIDNLDRIDFNDLINKWFAHFLYYVDNGIMKEMPTALIQNNTNLEFEGFNNWPVIDKKTTFYLDSTSNKLSESKLTEAQTASFVDDLSLASFDRAAENYSEWLDNIVLNPEITRPDRLAFVTDTLTKDTRISGTVTVKLTAAIDKPTANITAMLVDYGDDFRPTIDLEVLSDKPINYGGNAGSDYYRDFIIEDEASPYKVITRGWMDAQNRIANYRVDEIIPNQEYTFTLDLQPMDYTVKEGHKLGLLILSTDAEGTTRPFITTNFTVNITETSVEIPVVK